MIYKLIEADSPSLMMKLPETSIEEIKEKYNLTTQELYDNLKGTMAAMRGIGLSANQCGLPIRAFVMYTDLKDGNIEMYINPKIIWQSEETDYFVEGCLTYPHLFLNLKRPNLIEFEYMDMEGNQQKGKFGGARVYLQPASQGTGVIAGGAVRAVLEAVGVHDVLSKSQGSSNPHNVVKATFDALLQLRDAKSIAKQRGISLDKVFNG